jgi:glutamate dehydrogenase/leucine dehydrogenase
MFFPDSGPRISFHPQILSKKGLLILPVLDILANSGGVTMSYFN